MRNRHYNPDDNCADIDDTEVDTMLVLRNAPVLLGKQDYKHKFHSSFI